MSAPNKTVAFLLATSGHSGVDRIMPQLMREFARRGLSVHQLKLRRHGPEPGDIEGDFRVIDLGVAHVLSSLFAVVRYLRRERPTVLLSDKDRVNRIALLARWLAHVPTRVAVRNGTTVSVDLRHRPRFQKWTHWFSMRWLYRAADAILVPSCGAADDLARFATIPRQRIDVVPNPVITPDMDDAAAQPTGHGWFDEDTPVVLGVGELGGRKDFATLIRAFAQLRAGRPCRLVILGRGRQRERLAALAADLGVGEEVALLGFKPNPWAYLARAQVFVLSSRWEGLSNVLIAALALGVPVVATDCPSGPREILDHGRHGELVPVGDAAAMAAAIGRTLDTEPDRQRLRTAAQPYRVKPAADQYLRVLGL